MTKIMRACGPGAMERRSGIHIGFRVNPTITEAKKTAQAAPAKSKKDAKEEKKAKEEPKDAPKDGIMVSTTELEAIRQVDVKMLL